MSTEQAMWPPERPQSISLIQPSGLVIRDLIKMNNLTNFQVD